MDEEINESGKLVQGGDAYGFYSEEARFGSRLGHWLF
jgi:hypothetical protein